MDNNQLLTIHKHTKHAKTVTIKPVLRSERNGGVHSLLYATLKRTIMLSYDYDS